MQEPERLGLLAIYGSQALRRMLIGVHETLRAAGRTLELSLGDAPGLDLAALRAAASSSGAENAARLIELLDRNPPAESLLDLSEYAVKGDDEYEQARQTAEQAALNAVAARDRELLQELLLGFDRCYQAAKDRESALDYDDLQLRARDLLRDDESIREREQLRFRQVCVDEFQDTNRLQCELIDLVARDELFFVGDEFQSIYRFLHADVEVFKERRDQIGEVLPLTHNWRSRPEILEVVNHLFAATFGDEFQQLVAAGRFPDPASGPAVELLVTDKASYKDAPHSWRRGEAKAVARRVKELVESGEAEPGEIVVLFAAGTDAEQYEEELRAAGLPTYRATGRGYFGQQQVRDLLGYLRLLHNRYDDEALVTVLASPFVGVSNDALALLRRAAPRRPLYTGLEKGLPAGLAERDRQLLQAFRQRYDRLTADRRQRRPRAAVRADPGRARLRPRGARPVGRPPALRQSAQARAARALLRGAARPRHRGLRALRARAGRGRRQGAGGGRRGGRRRRSPAADDPRRQGARVQGRRRRRRRPRPPEAERRGDHLPPGRPLRVQGRRPGERQAQARVRVRRGA